MLRKFFLPLTVFIVALTTLYWIVQPASFPSAREFELPFSANAESLGSSETVKSYAE